MADPRLLSVGDPARDVPGVLERMAAIDAALPRIKEWFAVGLIASVDEALGKVDDALTMWSISAARRFAWAQAETLWQLQDNPRLLAAYHASLERMVGFTGRSLLL